MDSPIAPHPILDAITDEPCLAHAVLAEPADSTAHMGIGDVSVALASIVFTNNDGTKVNAPGFHVRFLAENGPEPVIAALPIEAVTSPELKAQILAANLHDRQRCRLEADGTLALPDGRRLSLSAARDGLAAG